MQATSRKPVARVMIVADIGVSKAGTLVSLFSFFSTFTPLHSTGSKKAEP